MYSYEPGQFRKRINWTCKSKMINYKLSVAQLIKNKLIQRFILKIIIGVIVLILVFSDAVKAESLRSLIESGNRAYEQGNYVKSLDSYNKAAAAEPDSAIVQFNRGNALYKQGEYSDAFNVYEQAATRAMEENDPVLEAQSRYNMGNSSYRKAEVLSRENLEKALEEFNRSSEYYQSALNLYPRVMRLNKAKAQPGRRKPRGRGLKLLRKQTN